MKKTIERVSNIALDQASKVIMDYLWSGAMVSCELQNDRRMEITATFAADAKYPTSNIPVR